MKTKIRALETFKRSKREKIYIILSIQELTTRLIKCGNEAANRHMCVWEEERRMNRERKL